MSHPKDKEVRERLMARGVQALTDAELLSIIMGEGTAGVSAVDMAGDALSSVKADGAESALGALAGLDIPRLRMAGGMGVKRAATLAAAFEAGRRAAAAQSSAGETINSDGDVERIFRPLIGSLPHEEFWMICLSQSNRIIDRIKISQGGTSATVVDHKLIVKRAVECLAPAIIVVHNHPSHSASPSPEDVELTRRLQTAASLFDIALLDHIIVTPAGSFSFRREGIIE